MNERSRAPPFRHSAESRNNEICCIFSKKTEDKTCPIPCFASLLNAPIPIYPDNNFFNKHGNLSNCLNLFGFHHFYTIRVKMSNENPSKSKMRARKGGNRVTCRIGCLCKWYCRLFTPEIDRSRDDHHFHPTCGYCPRNPKTAPKVRNKMMISSSKLRCMM